jgi:hypothetical protein
MNLCRCKFVNQSWFLHEVDDLIRVAGDQAEDTSFNPGHIHQRIVLGSG